MEFQVSQSPTVSRWTARPAAGSWLALDDPCNLPGLPRRNFQSFQPKPFLQLRISHILRKLVPYFLHDSFAALQGLCDVRSLDREAFVRPLEEGFRIVGNECKELELISEVEDFSWRIPHILEELLDEESSP